MDQTLELLRSKAETCQDLASNALTPDAREVLAELAQQYRDEAVALERSPRSRPRRQPAFDWH